jgi:very-short-patch-repair endonuclease
LASAPFTKAQALQYGVTPSALRSAPWRRVFWGIWVHESVPDTCEIRLAAARLAIPDHAVVCEATAAWLYGADVRAPDDVSICVSYPPGQRRRPQPGLVVKEEMLGPGDVVSVRGVRLTSPVRTAFDCLRLLRGAEGLVVADALTHLGFVTLAELRAYFAAARRRRNLRVGERLLELVEPLVESPMETRMRWQLIRSGLPIPVAQYEVRDRTGRFVARLDFAYPALKVAMEFDGSWHWSQRREDDRRRHRLRELGWTVLVFSADDVYGDPIGMAAAVIRACEQARRTA